MTAGDANGLHRIHTEAVRQVYAKSVASAVVEAWVYGRTPEGYLRAAGKGGETFWIAVEAPERIVGFASWRADELVGLHVDPRFHGRGTGRQLFAACEKDAEQSGYVIVRVNSTLNAQSYYKALGFRRVRDGYRERRGQRIPHVEMVPDAPSSAI